MLVKLQFNKGIDVSCYHVVLVVAKEVFAAALMALGLVKNGTMNTDSEIVALRQWSKVLICHHCRQLTHRGCRCTPYNCDSRSRGTPHSVTCTVYRSS